MKVTLLFTILASLLIGSASFADKDKMEKKEMPTMTKEQREKMAVAHEKMAACLRSTKSLQDCHEEMKKSCKDNMGDKCPMMMMGHHEHDMGKMQGDDKGSY